MAVGTRITTDHGTVTSVTASLPLASSGGATPNISVSSSTGTGAIVLQTSPTIKTPVIVDSNSNNALTVGTVASAVNYLQVTNAATGTYPQFLSLGTDSNIGMGFQCHGTGQVYIGSAGANVITFISNSPNHNTTFAFPTTTGSQTVTFPDASFTVGAAQVWTSEPSAGVTLVANNGYFAASGSQLTFTLPVTAAVGDTFQVAASAAGTGGWIIAQNSGQAIQLGNLATTTGATGKLTAHNGAGDWVILVCSIANTNFVASMRQGSCDVT